jgi:hypothetical protein
VHAGQDGDHEFQLPSADEADPSSVSSPQVKPLRQHSNPYQAGNNASRHAGTTIKGPMRD